ncbi:MAG: HepT-like ribonuclease domain-containing protein [Cyclobacteriaceae bacterium]
MTDWGKKYLSDILWSIELIEEFLLSVSDFKNYKNDLKTQSAVERQLGIIGEAVNKFDKLFPEATLKNARKIVGFRNRLIHAYDAVDPAMVWAIVKNHIRPLKDEVTDKINE